MADTQQGRPGNAGLAEMVVFHSQRLSIRAATFVMVVISRAFLAIVLMAIRGSGTQITFGARFDGLTATGLDFFVEILQANRTQRERDENADNHHPCSIASQDALSNHGNESTQAKLFAK